MSSIKHLIGRAVIKRIASNATQLQVTALANEVREVWHVDTYGLATSPLPDMQAVVVYPFGDRKDGIVVSAIDNNTRPQVASGEVVVYTHDGTQIRLSRSGTVRIKATNVVIEGNLQVNGQTQLQNGAQITGNATVSGQVAAAGFGGAGSAPAAMSSGANITGTLAIDGNATIGGEQVITQSHTHIDAEGRPTREAQ